MENLQPSDVVTNSRDLIVALNIKTERLISDVKDLKDDMFARVSKIETRLDLVDTFHASIPLKDYDNIAKWAINFRSNLKFLLTVGGLSLAVVGGVVSQMLIRLFHI